MLQEADAFVDARLYSLRPSRRFLAVGLLLAIALVSPAWVLPRDEPPAKIAKIDATTLHHKVMCGYQGWFRCPGDPVKLGWRHWSRDPKKIAPDTLTFEMWPDMTEYSDEEKFAAGGFTYPDGKQAQLFSSTHPKTVARHFKWMEQYGIDGVFLQRFLVEVAEPGTERVLKHVRASAAASGRVYAMCYDLSGASKDKLFDQLVADWKRLVDDAKVTQDKQYLHHNGKPVLMVWGFFSDRFDAALAHRIIDFLKNDKRYGVTLIGGCEREWRSVKNAGWAKAFRRFDAISPWNVGHATKVGQRHFADTDQWKHDFAEAKKAKMHYLPVLYPGFGWTNLQGKKATRQTLPRVGGEFFVRQFLTAAELGIEMAYVAMFDEVDEGTAIFKVTNTPPKQAHFDTYEGLPSDFYLRLTGEGSRLIRRERIKLTLPKN